ncbi:MAG: pyridoxal 5'-phosphate synthase glutaminase subunit PdxT [Hamadaea sp.]|uniref:pyridoxal 5'-phosphate synthase glutaminase subunit PdxT n=1 Tax=Hamadaea sp. TaxID=2024425 RepID=UPI00181A17BD|nr:pyridoxal 5'-phosphate synthase glutaminase subunit PdxT [Hamadaea sp.]NUR69823.1 pyridoxal 5'-phosphate synthase glutaminase subunit PdxT [Hamadaea sp.]NUT19197.1 pyridoxal 5'-phosphate synthase glutaminase subunit PdxT [Hamadaea sp.]
MNDPIIGVLALQGDFREHLAALAECDVIARPVRRPAEVDEIDALIIPGGESTTMSKLAQEFEVFDPIAARLRAGMPAYGTCAGMIMLAEEVLDGRPDQRSFGGLALQVRRNAFGRQVDSFETPVEIAGVEGGPVPAVFIRAPWVEKVIGDVEVLGQVGDGPEARIVAVRQGNLLATSFHPELTGDLRLHRYFVDMVRSAV